MRQRAISLFAEEGTDNLDHAMSPIHELTAKLRGRRDLHLIEEMHSWLITIPKGGLICEVTVPFDVLEWHACVKHRREDKEIWSDWMDYSGYDDRPRTQLESEMADDILAFLNRVSAAESLPIRIHEPRP